MINSTTTLTVTKSEYDESKVIIKKRRIKYPKYEEYKACTCGGEYHQTGICYTTHPAQYEYRCNKCGNTLVLME